MPGDIDVINSNVFADRRTWSAPGSADPLGFARCVIAAMMLKRQLAAIFAVFSGLLICMTVAQAQQSYIDFEEKSWEEQKLQLPAYPKESNLKQIDIGPVTSFRFFVDTESINVGADGVVRFTLMARSASGAANVSFEGLRCKTQEKKIYAVGRTDGTWVEARNPAWTDLARQHVNPAQTVLYEDFFCPERNIVSSTSEAVDSIRNGGNPLGRTRR